MCLKLKLKICLKSCISSEINKKSAHHFLIDTCLVSVTAVGLWGGSGAVNGLGGGLAVHDTSFVGVRVAQGDDGNSGQDKKL
jgi:hypothetical protein